MKSMELNVNDGYIYTKVKMTIDGKLYIGAAIGRGCTKDELIKTERSAIRNLLDKINNKNTNGIFFEPESE